VTFTTHILFAILPAQAAFYLDPHKIKRHGNLNKVAIKSYRPHAVMGMWLLYRKLVSPSTWTNKVLMSQDREEYASA
jgi:hypothetical protein